MGVYGVARLGSIHNTYDVPSEPERAAKARRAIVASASNENITKYKNLCGVKSISNSVQRLARYRFVALISIGRLCMLRCFWRIQITFWNIKRNCHESWNKGLSVLTATISNIHNVFIIMSSNDIVFNFSSFLCPAFSNCSKLQLNAFILTRPRKPKPTAHARTTYADFFLHQLRIE